MLCHNNILPCNSFLMCSELMPNCSNRNNRTVNIRTYCSMTSCNSYTNNLTLSVKFLYYLLKTYFP